MGYGIDMSVLLIVKHILTIIRNGLQLYGIDMSVKLIVEHIIDNYPQWFTY